ncbi:hypothetical protein OG205_46735 [Lentzea sp. NBC_00516]|nr:hypothetical protein [Lentzea sp. NBC_00516]WUD25419.1 hypothetical protein OG205_46735 [Lentzea sp. NBC_00516]
MARGSFYENEFFFHTNGEEAVRARALRGYRLSSAADVHAEPPVR